MLDPSSSHVFAAVWGAIWDHIYHKFIPASNTVCCLSGIYIGLLTSALPKNFWQSLPGAVALTADVHMAENLPKPEETWVPTSCGNPFTTLSLSGGPWQTVSQHPSFSSRFWQDVCSITVEHWTSKEHFDIKHKPFSFPLCILPTQSILSHDYAAVMHTVLHYLHILIIFPFFLVKFPHLHLFPCHFSA